MSLDVYLKDPTAKYETEPLYWANITHNLGEMAEKAGISSAAATNFRCFGFNIFRAISLGMYVRVYPARVDRSAALTPVRFLYRFINIESFSPSVKGNNGSIESVRFTLAILLRHRGDCF